MLYDILKPVCGDPKFDVKVSNIWSPDDWTGDGSCDPQNVPNVAANCDTPFAIVKESAGQLFPPSRLKALKVAMIWLPDGTRIDHLQMTLLG